MRYGGEYQLCKDSRMAASTNVLCVCEYYQFNYNLFSIHPGITYYLDQQMYHAGRDNLYVSVGACS